MKLSVWKVLGVAGVAGVTATGAIIARDHRRRAQIGPDEVRHRLHQRLAEVQGEHRTPAEDAPDGGPS